MEPATVKVFSRLLAIRLFTGCLIKPVMMLLTWENGLGVHALI